MPRPRSPRPDASRRYHDRVARRYDAIYDDPYWAFHDELTWRHIKPHLPRDAVGRVQRPGLRHRQMGPEAAQERASPPPSSITPPPWSSRSAEARRAGRRGAARRTLIVADIVDMPALPPRHLRAVAGHGRSAVDLLRPPPGRPRDGPHHRPAASPSPPPTTSSPPSTITSSALTRRTGNLHFHRQNQLAHRRRARAIRAHNLHPRGPAPPVRIVSASRCSTFVAKQSCPSVTTPSC